MNTLVEATSKLSLEASEDLFKDSFIDLVKSVAKLFTTVEERLLPALANSVNKLSFSFEDKEGKRDSIVLRFSVFDFSCVILHEMTQ